MTHSVLEIANVTKVYEGGLIKKKRFLAVNNVSLSLAQGRTLGLLGPSGCGKTTLARLVLGLIPPSSGRILIGGEDLFAASAPRRKDMRRRMQYISQHPESFFDPSMRMIDSLLEPMRIHNLYDKQKRQQIVRDLLRTVGLNEPLLHRYPHQLSGGEMQRLAIARALTLSPSLIILDEPTSMLDVSVQAQVLHLLRTLQREMGVAYLFISHDVDVVKWFCDDVAYMNKGRITQICRADTLS